MKGLQGSAAGAEAHAGVEDALRAYETALNGSDVDGVLAVFAADSVFMAPNKPSTAGADAVGAAYRGIFAAIAFETELTIAEIVQVAPDWAFVRTDSKGFVTVYAIKQRMPDANHELFVMNKGGDGRWRIARYAFSSTLPPPQ